MARANSTTCLRAGVAQVEITPKMGTQIAGSVGIYRPARQVINPIFAKALTLSSADRKLCILSLDVPLVTTDWATKIRNVAAERFGLDPEAIMIHSVQNHAAPSIGHAQISANSPYIPPELSWLRGGDDEYTEFALERILEAIRLAHLELEPARIGVGSGLEWRVAHNRRWVMRDGTVHVLDVAHGDPNILFAEGPIDPE